MINQSMIMIHGLSPPTFADTSGFNQTPHGAGPTLLMFYDVSSNSHMLFFFLFSSSSDVKRSPSNQYSALYCLISGSSG